MNPSQPPHGIFEHIDSPTLNWTLGLLILAGVLLLVFAIFVFIQSRLAKQKAEKLLRKDPWEELLLQLGVQKNAGSRQQLLILSQVLRKALELKTKQPFTAWTSTELLQNLAEKDVFSSDFQMECAEFLKLADLVIFTEQEHPDGDLVRHYQQLVEQWIERMKVGQSL